MYKYKLVSWCQSVHLHRTYYKLVLFDHTLYTYCTTVHITNWFHNDYITHTCCTSVQDLNNKKLKVDILKGKG